MRYRPFDQSQARDVLGISSKEQQWRKSVLSDLARADMPLHFGYVLREFVNVICSATSSESVHVFLMFTFSPWRDALLGMWEGILCACSEEQDFSEQLVSSGALTLIVKEMLPSTVRFHVDDLMSSHVNKKVNNKFLKWLNRKCGTHAEVTSTMG